MVGRDEPLVSVTDARSRIRGVEVLAGVSIEVPRGGMVGVVGPDGVGKSTLLALVAGARRASRGAVRVLGGDLRDPGHRRRVSARIAYLPQGLGRNLYPTLSVAEHLEFFGRLHGHAAEQRARLADELARATDLHQFGSWPVERLSGGMRQKLGLACALLHAPELIVLDEPTTGLDPLSRLQFWELIDRIRAAAPETGFLIATACLDEAPRFDQVVAMGAGRVLAHGSPSELLRSTAARDFDEAYAALMGTRPAHAERAPAAVPPTPARSEWAIEARGLTLRYGDFTAVDGVELAIRRGEIFGFLGSNGCGKTTTMKVLAGLLPTTQGEVLVLGKRIDARNPDARRRVGYMSQGFSLFRELTVRQNLRLHARLHGMPPATARAKVEEMLDRFGLRDAADRLPQRLPLGVRQRLSLAVALVHGPELLILDEPTTGVDPAAREAFWSRLRELSRSQGVTIFVSTHLMGEGARCDRVSFMHAGKVLRTGAPEALVRESGAASLEAAFVACMRAAGAGARLPEGVALAVGPAAPPATSAMGFSFTRAWCWSWREALELARDPVRALLGVVGTLVLLVVMGVGISMDVEDLAFAVLDRDRTLASADYALHVAGSPYFREHAELRDESELDARMASGELALALELPPGFARDLARGDPVEIGAWADGSMPRRAELAAGYMQGLHQSWLDARALERTGHPRPAQAGVETRFRYNPDVKSRPAMVPAVVPLLLLMVPAMLAALAVVREKELGTIVNFQATPTSRAEFLLGKQLPYVVLAFANFLLLTWMSVQGFGVRMNGSFAALAVAALAYVVFATGYGLLCSSFTRSQVGAILAAVLLTILPAVQFGGLLTPVSALEGVGAWIARLFPASHYIELSRGVHGKQAGWSELASALPPIVAAAIVATAASIALLRKQER